MEVESDDDAGDDGGDEDAVDDEEDSVEDHGEQRPLGPHVAPVRLATHLVRHHLTTQRRG